MYCRGVVLPLKLRALSSPPGVHHIGAVLKSATNVLWTPAAATRELQATNGTITSLMGKVEGLRSQIRKCEATERQYKAKVRRVGLCLSWLLFYCFIPPCSNNKVCAASLFLLKPDCKPTQASWVGLLVWAYSLVSARTSLQHRLCLASTPRQGLSVCLLHP